MAVRVCGRAKVLALGSWRRFHFSNSALPRTIPVRNVPSISVNAYVELPSCVESRRVQPISYDMAVAPTIAKQIRKNIDGAEEGGASTFSGKLISFDDR